MTAPRRQHTHETTDTTGTTGASGTTDGRGRETDWPHRQGLALVELLEHLPTDHLHGKVAATVVVTINHDHLRSAINTINDANNVTGADSLDGVDRVHGVGVGPGHLDTGGELSAGEARRIACGAGILPTILNGASMPIDVGRAQRFFTQTQRTALATLYDECATTGCDRPYAWSELHHQHPWAHGGHTDLREAIPVCWFHHRRLHDPTYHHTITPDPDHPARKRVSFRQKGADSARDRCSG